MKAGYSEEVDDYIRSLPQQWWRDTVEVLRGIIHDADPGIEESIKWGTPAFSHAGQVAWLFCAKEWVHFSLNQGALLDHGHGLFEPTDNKAMRTIKLHKGQPIPEALIVMLIKTTVMNNLAGKKIVFEKEPRRPVVLPPDVNRALKAAKLIDTYWTRPYYQQKGYVQWLDEAKRPETRQKRLETMLRELEAGTYMPPKRDR